MKGASQSLATNVGAVVAAWVGTAAIFVSLVMHAQRNVDVRSLPSEGRIPPSFDREYVVGKVRFVFLTEWAVRIERSPSLRFENRPTLIFSERPAFLAVEVPVRVRISEDPALPGVLLLRTSLLEVQYGNVNDPYGSSPEFTSKTLVAKVRRSADLDQWTTWKYGRRDLGNLKGTRKTLDHTEGEAELEDGLLSRYGFCAIEDTESPLLDRKAAKGEIRWVRSRGYEKGYRDVSLFGYGWDMRKMLGTYVRLAGRVPVPPKFTLGLWWSRWWPYSDRQLQSLVEEFERHEVPLDVLVIDMDWHLTSYAMMNAGYRDLAGEPLGWTGYTWNSTLFPDPAKFLSWCHQRGLKTTLNLHPAGGIQPWEDAFPAMARAMEVDPDPQARNFVPFDIADRKFARAYFDLVLRPLERQGIDFWWLDWQQRNTTTIRNLNPTIWLNHVFFNDLERRRPVAIPSVSHPRGIIFHRWGGLGSHRYQVGFSGDVTTSWASLRFQVYFTLTAANVAFGHWSHDIGGFLSRSSTPPELFTRWVQWGAVSAVFRTHSWRQNYLERRIWKYPPPHFQTMREAIRLRFSLVPYLYTLNREFYETGIAPVHPLYYWYPRDDRAYDYDTQFMLGSDLLVSPVVAPMQTHRFVQNALFLPEGTWIEWHTGTVIHGPTESTRLATLEDVPIYVRAGTQLPMSIPRLSIQATATDPLVLTCFPGPALEAGTTSLYDDDGASTAYRDKSSQQGGSARTNFSMECSFAEAQCHITVEPCVGSYRGMPQEHSFLLRLAFVPPPDAVHIDGEEVVRDDAAVPVVDSAVHLQWSMRREQRGASSPMTSADAPADAFWSYDADRFTAELRTSSVPASSGTRVEFRWADKDVLREGLALTHSGIFGHLRRASKIRETARDAATRDTCREAQASVQDGARREKSSEWLQTIHDAKERLRKCIELVPDSIATA